MNTPFNTTEFVDTFMAEWDETTARLDADAGVRDEIVEGLNRVQATVLWHVALRMGTKMAEELMERGAGLQYEATSCYPANKLREWVPNVDFGAVDVYDTRFIARLIAVLEEVLRDDDRR
jgi:hypothetical protein